MPTTKIPDEEAGPDSGGEENTNVDGRKRGHWMIENEEGAPY
jgi:hypothetical protein